MRRKDKECADRAVINSILDQAEILYLAIMTDSYPYCLPVNFAREGAKIYIHSAVSGAKLDYLRENSQIAFSTAIDIEIDTARSTTYYKSVCGNGKASIVEDAQEKGRALDLLAERYKARCMRPAPERDIMRVAILRIDIREISGKISAPRPEA